jgi:KUP system potassium uptake protein
MPPASRSPFNNLREAVHPAETLPISIPHRTVLLVRVITENILRVAGADRIKARNLGSGFWQIEAHFGFAQTPNILRELGRVQIPGLELDPSQLSFFVGRANVKSS